MDNNRKNLETTTGFGEVMKNAGGLTSNDSLPRNENLYTG